MSAVKPVLSPLTRCALETEAHVATLGWGQEPRLFSLAKNSELLRRQPGLRALLGDIDPDEYSAIEQEGALTGTDLEEALGHMAWPQDVDGVAIAVERIVVPPQAETETCGRAGTSSERLASHEAREDVRLLVAALRGGEIITLVRRKAEDDDDKVAIGINIAPGLVEALKATLG